MEVRNYVQANGRRDFDREDYDKYDGPGKNFAYHLLKWLEKFQPELLKTLFGNYRNIEFKIVERKSYGDILVVTDGFIQLCEVEARPDHHFKGNFYELGTYKTGINVPQKDNIKTSNGIFLSINGDDAINFMNATSDETIPDSFIIIKTTNIVQCPLEPPQTKDGLIDKKNNDYKYKVPHSMAIKFGWDSEKYAEFKK